MKQSILPFCLVLVLLGAAYFFKNQWADGDKVTEPDKVAQRDTSDALTDEKSSSDSKINEVRSKPKEYRKNLY